MHNGKLTFSTPSTHPKKNAKCWREKNVSGKHILQENKFMTNEWVKKNQSFSKPPNPSPLGPSEVKWFAPQCPPTSFMKGTLVVQFLQGATSSKQPVNFIILVAFSCEVRL